MIPRQLLAVVVMLVVFAACSGGDSLTGPRPSPEPEPEPGPASRIEITSPDGSDTLTLRMLKDTVDLTVRAFDAEGREISDPEVEWVTNDPDIFEVTEDGGVFRQPAEDEVFSIRDDRGSVPPSPDPLPGTITATVGKVEETREFVRTSPTTWVNVSPDAICTQAPGRYEDPFSDAVAVVDSPKVTSATIDARDFWARARDVTGTQWASSDTSIATVEASPDPVGSADIFIADAGLVDISATVDGITDTLTIESSDEIEWNPDGSGSGRVKCSTGPGASIQAAN